MKVTVRDIKRPDAVIREFPIYPQVQLPYPGSLLLLPRLAYEPKRQRARVAHYEWDLEEKETGDLDIRMIVAFE